MTNSDKILINLSDNLPIGILTFNTDFLITSWNTHLAELTAISTSEALGHPVIHLINNAELSLESQIQELFSGNKPELQEHVNISLGENSIAASIKVKVVKDRDILLGGMCLVSDNIVAYKTKDPYLPQNILNTISDGIITIDHEYRITFFNKIAENLLKKNAKVAIGKKFQSVFPEIVNTQIATKIIEVIENQEVRIFEAHYQSISKWLEIRAYPFRGGALVYFQVMANEDQNEIQFSDKEIIYRRIIGQIQDGIIVFDNRGVISEWNNSLETISGISKQEVLNKRVVEIIQKLNATMSNGKIPSFLSNDVYDGSLFDRWFGLFSEWKISTQSGLEKVVHIGINRVDFANDYLFVCVLKDITDQKAIQEKLENSNENLSITLNSIGDAVITTDQKGYITRLNPVAEKITGWKHEAAYGKFITEVLRVVNPNTGHSRNNPIMKVLETGRRADLADGAILISRNKKKYQIADSAAPIKKDKGKIVGVVMVFRDITKDYINAQKIKEMEERFRVAFKTSPDAIAITRLEDGIYLEVNEGFLKMSGYSQSELVGNSAYDINIWKHTSDREKLVSALMQDGYIDNLEAKFVLKDGSEITGLMSARIIMLNSVKYLLSITRDITSRKKTEEELKASEARIRNILKYDPTGIAIFDRDMNFLMVSDKFLEDNYPHGNSIIGKNYYDIFPEAPEDYKIVFQKCVEGNVEKKELDQIVRPNGETDYIKWENRPWHNSEGVIGGVVLYVEVITQRIRTEKKLLKRKDLIENVLARLPVGIVTLKLATGEVDYINDQCLQIFDLSSGSKTNIHEVINSSVLVFKDEMGDLKGLLDTQFRTIKNYIHWESVEILTKANHRKTIALYHIPLPEQDISILAFQDITSRKQAEEERDRLYNFSIDMLFVAGFDGFLKQVNPAWEKTLGWSDEELFSTPWLTRVYKQDQQKTRIAHAKLQEGKSMILFENRFLCKDGKFKWLSWNAIPLTDQNLIFGIVRDTTSNKVITEELKIRNSELNNFVYKVSHDLRAPLSSIRGLVSLIKLELPGLTEHEYIRLIENRIMKLDNFIRDILSHSKNLNTEINISRIYFKEVIDNCFAELAYLENTSRINKHIVISDEEFYNDHIRIYEIFRNLLSNSIKYLNPYIEENLVNIEILVDQHKAEITISDNGIGIDPKIQARVFEMFFKGSDKSDSSGIGLYIVQQAVNKLDGLIRLESESNKGTKFMITLPNRKPL